jgi:glycosyltransferase involved in cell wall biosynthesis
MKVAIISSGFLPVVDGVTVTLLNRLQQLSQQGHQVLLFCPDYSSLKDIYPDWQSYTGEFLPGVNIVNLASTPFMDLDFERNVSKASYQNLLQELQKFQPEVIQVDEPERLFMGFLKVPGVDFAKRAGIPCLSFFHTNFIEYGEDYLPLPPLIDTGVKFLVSSLFAWIYNSYDATLVASSVTHQKISKMGIKNAILNENLLGVDVTKFQPSLRAEQFFEKNYGLSGLAEKIKLVFLGRLTPDKGWEFTLNAFPKLMQAIDLTNVAILIAGDGPLREQIGDRLNQLTPNVYFLGRISPEAVPALLVNSDIHITTSEKETRGLTVLEALAAGIPVVAPRAGGLIDSIREGETGLLFNPQDQEDFVNKLKCLIENPTLRREMGEKGRMDVMSQGWDNTIENLIKIWNEQIAKKANCLIA